MKKTLIGATAAVLIAAGAVGTPYYLGSKAEQSLAVQHRALANTFFVEIVSHDYQRGIFQSTETTVLRIKPTVLANLSRHMPDNIRTILEKPITLINHVKHQPFANGWLPVRAVVDTDFQYDSAVQKTLARFFGNQTPVSLHNVIDLSGSGNMQIRIAPFDYEELSGIKLNWQGLTTDVAYQDQFSEYRTHWMVPALKATLADKGSLNAEQLDITSISRTASDGETILGQLQTTLGKFDVAWQNGVDYNIRLNDLVNMVTDLQIGAFINPNGTIAPNHISVRNLKYSTQINEPKTGYLDTQGVFSFAQLQYGDNQYGPLNIDVAANHLNSGSLNALKSRWQQIISEKHSDEEQRQLLLAAVRKEGAPLFTDNPIFLLKKFQFVTPTGHLNAQGKMQFNGLQQSDLNNISPLIAKMQAELNLDISQKFIEEFAIAQLRNLFTVEDSTSEQEQQDISDTIRLLTNNTLQDMTREGYLHQDNGSVKTQLLIANNLITLNNKTLQTQSDEDLFADLNDNALPEKASAVSSAH